MKKLIDGKMLVFLLLVIIFSAIESILILSYPQFGNSIGEYQFRYVRWQEDENIYCFTYQNMNYRTIRIYSKSKKKSDTYKVILESMEEIYINQTEETIYVPDREGMTDFDHYKKVFDKKSNRIISKILDYKTKSLLPQNILSMLFIVTLNSGFASMIVYSEKIHKYKNLFFNFEGKKKKNGMIRYRKYQVIGIICMFVLLAACFF